MNVRISSGAPEQAAVDAIILPLLEGERKLPSQIVPLDRKLGGALEEMVRTRQFTGKFMEQAQLHSLGRLRCRWMLAVGMGKSGELDLVRFRNALQSAARSLRRRGQRRLAVTIPSGFANRWEIPELVRAAVEGIALGNFDAGALKTQPDGARGEVTALTILGVGGGTAAAAAVSAGLLLAEATNTAREWVNLPANALTPSVFAEKARDLARAAGLECRVLELADIRRLKMGALLAVARGSDEPARLIVLRYRGGRAGSPTLGLVGKGITFDSGGISIKVAAGMEKMRGDMGGGAAVVGAMRAIAGLKPAVNVIGVVPATENMPSGKATKPGDVVTASSGKTVEIVNTDAEGRLILADGITYAIGQGATHIVDVATLTGSIRRTLGPVATGAFGNDAGLMELVRRAADLAGERVWELPIWPDYDGLIRSEVADIKNSTVAWAGATTAALFLREFVQGRPWVHLDIAGSAWQDDTTLKTIPPGPTGAGVRLLAQLAGLLAG